MKEQKPFFKLVEEYFNFGLKVSKRGQTIIEIVGIPSRKEYIKGWLMGYSIKTVSEKEFDARFYSDPIIKKVIELKLENDKEIESAKRKIEQYRDSSLLGPNMKADYERSFDYWQVQLETLLAKSDVFEAKLLLYRKITYAQLIRHWDDLPKTKADDIMQGIIDCEIQIAELHRKWNEFEKRENKTLEVVQQWRFDFKNPTEEKEAEIEVVGENIEVEAQG